MLKIELVEQTTKFNCGSAALAMILGLPSPEHVERDHLGRDDFLQNHLARGGAAMLTVPSLDTPEGKALDRRGRRKGLRSFDRTKISLISRNSGFDTQS